MNATKTLAVRLMHNASIPGARWCVPVGWAPTNEIEDAEYVDGSWWGVTEEEAGLVWFGDVNAYGAEEVVEASPDDLRVASCGDCHVLDEVKLMVFDEGAEEGLPVGWCDEIVCHTFRDNQDGTVTVVALVNLYATDGRVYTGERVIHLKLKS